MSKRGPKPRLAVGGPILGLPGRHVPTAELSETERREFDRLLEELRRRGTLEKVEMGAVTDAARLAVALAEAYQAEPFNPRAVGVLQGHLRGVRREMGLSLQSSRVVTHTVPDSPDSARAYWRSKMGGGQ